MTVRIKLFSSLRAQCGFGEVETPLQEATRAIDLFRNLFPNHEEAERWLRFVRFAINCTYVPAETQVNDGDEVAFIPPVSGG